MKSKVTKQRLAEIANKKVPFKEAVKLLATKGITLKKVDEEYIVNFRGGKEATAYFTDSLADAIGTGEHMAKHRDKKAT